MKAVKRGFASWARGRAAAAGPLIGGDHEDSRTEPRARAEDERSRLLTRPDPERADQRAAAAYSHLLHCGNEHVDDLVVKTCPRLVG